MWKGFRGRGETSILIVNFYIPVPPKSGGVPVPVYAQHMTHFSNLRSSEYPRTESLSDLAEDINYWKNKEYQIIIIGDIN